MSEIQKALDDVFTTITTARKEDKTYVKEQFDKISSDSADQITKLNLLQEANKTKNAQIKKFEDQLEGLEKRMARTFSGKEIDAVSDFDKEYMDAKKNHLLHNTPVERDLNVKYVTEKLKSYLPYLSTENRLEVAKGYVTKTYQEGTAPDGGFFVIPSTSPDQIVRRFETSPIGAFATRMPTTTLQKRFFINDTLTGATTQTGELQTLLPAATATFGEIIITAHKMKQIQIASNEILQDPIVNFDTIIMDKIDQRFTLDENNLFVNGTGSQEARGILDYPEWGGAAVQFGNDNNYQRAALETIQSGSATGITYDGLINIQNALVAFTAQANSGTDNDPQLYEANARWMAQRETWGNVLRLKDTQDRPLFIMQDLLRDGAPPGILLGKPVVFAANIPAVSAGSGAKVMLYGDFRSAYTILDRLGMQVIRDIYTQASEGAVRWIVYKRMGAALTNYQALKVLQLEPFSAPLAIQAKAITSQHIQNIEDARRIAAEELAKESMDVDKQSLIETAKVELKKDKSFMKVLDSAKKEAVEKTSTKYKESKKRQSLDKSKKIADAEIKTYQHS